MNILAYALAVTLAQALPVPSVPPAPQAGVIVSADVGLGVAWGKADGAERAGSGVLDVVPKALPFRVAAGYRFDPSWSADVNLTYAPLALSGGCAEDNASASETFLGAALRWHRPSQRIVRPWLSLGLGYERFRYVGGCPDVELKGVDLDFQVGGDIHVSLSWTLGPFASLRVGTYLHTYAQSHDRSGAGGPIDEAVSVGDLALHEWLSIGLRGTFTSAPMPPASAADADYREGFLVMPFLGVHWPIGDTFNPGFRAGFLAGHHVWSAVSVNAELAVDFMNVNGVPELSIKAYVADLVLAPLYHLQLARGEFVVGPLLGGFRLSSVGRNDQEQTARGLAYGLNMGVFGAVGDLALGGLLGYTRRHTTEVDVAEQSVQLWNAPDVVSVTLAAMF